MYPDSKPTFKSLPLFPITLSKVLLMLLFCIFFKLPEVFSQNQTLFFNRVTVAEGLSQNSVFAIAEDPLGFTWLGTQQGLNRIVGNKVNKYLPENDSICGNIIYSIVRFDNSRFIVGTDQGLAYFNFVNEKYEKLNLINHIDSFTRKKINTIFHDSNTANWIGTDNGLFYIKENTIFSTGIKSKIKAIVGTDKPNQIIVTSATVIYRVTKKLSNLEVDTLAATSNYTYESSFYDPHHNEVLVGSSMDTLLIISDGSEIQKINQNNNISTTPLFLSSIYRYDQNELWVGTKSGLLIIQKKDDKITRRLIKKRIGETRSLSDNDIQIVFKNSNNHMFLGTFEGGLCQFIEGSKYFNTFMTPEISNTLQNNSYYVWSIQKEDNDHLWLGTRNNGLLKINTSSKEVKQININNSTSKNITCLFKDSINSVLWIGTATNGVYYSSTIRGNLFFQTPTSISGNILKNTNISCIVPGRKNELLIGTREKGVFKINLQTKIITRLNHSKLYNNVYSLNYYEKKDKILIGSYGQGLFLSDYMFEVNQKLIFNINSNVFNCHKPNAKILSIITSNQDNVFWVGTSRNGIFKYEFRNDEIRCKNFTTFNSKLLSNTIYGIVEDNDNHLWISTNRGLILANPNSNTPEDFVVEIFDLTDGLLDVEFNAGATYFNKNKNVIYFGGISGMIGLNPNEIKTIYSANKPVFKITNVRVTPPFENSSINSFSILNTEHFPVSNKSFPIFIKVNCSNQYHSKDIYNIVEIQRNGKKIEKKFTEELVLNLSDLDSLSNGFFGLTGDYTISFFSTTESNIKWIKGQQVFLELKVDFEYYLRQNINLLYSALLIFLIATIAYLIRKRKRQKKLQETINKKNIELENKQVELNKTIDSLNQSKNEVEKQKEKLDNYTKTLERNQKEVLKVSEEITSQNKQLNELPSIINQVSTETTVESICEATCQLLLDYFKFDYAAISTADFFTNRVKHDYLLFNFESKTALLKNIGDENLAGWKEMTNYDFNDSDIIPLIFKGKLSKLYPNDEKVYHTIIGDQINGKKVIWDENCPINKTIFQKYDHKNLKRILFRITFKTGKENRNQNFEEFPIGVVEAGYYKNTRSITDLFETSFISRLNLFVDNIAQPYILASKNQIETRLNRLYYECTLHSADFVDVIRFMLKEVCSLLDCEKGVFIFHSINEKKLHFGKKNPIYFNLKENEIFDLNDLINALENPKMNHLWDSITTGKIIKVLNMDEIILPKHNSQLTLPLVHDGEFFGLICLLTKKHKYFNEYILPFLKEFLDKITKECYGKKLLKSIALLADDFRIYSDRKDTFSILVGRVEEYLFFKYVGVWTYPNDENSNILSFLIGSPSFTKINNCSENNFLDQNYISSLEGNYIFHKTSNFEDKNLNKKSNADHHFKSFLLINFTITSDFKGVLIIFFKKEVNKLVKEDELILSYILSGAKNTILSNQWIETTRFNTDEGEEVVKGEEAINLHLQQTVDRAKEQVDADQVILFWQEKRFIGTTAFRICKSGKFQYQFIYDQKDSLNFEEENNMVSTALNYEKPIIVIKNKQDYNERFSKSKRKWESKHYNDDYFNREKLSASMSVKIGENIGLLFFNFKNPLDPELTDEKRRIISAIGIIVGQIIREVIMYQELSSLIEATINQSKVQTDNYLASTIAHNTGNLVAELNMQFLNIKHNLERKHKKKEIPKLVFEEFLSKIEIPLRRLVTNFSKFSQYRGTSSNKKEWITVNDLVNSSLELIQFTIKRHKVRINIEKKLSSSTNKYKVYCLKTLIMDSIINIVINALEAIPKKGEIIITTSTDQSKKYAIITVMDDGVGILQNIKPFIFKPNFSHGKPGGTGLGLYSSKIIIEEDHQGMLKVDEKRDRKKGATFEIYLPIEDNKLKR